MIKELNVIYGAKECAVYSLQQWIISGRIQAALKPGFCFDPYKSRLDFIPFFKRQRHYTLRKHFKHLQLSQPHCHRIESLSIYINNVSTLFCNMLSFLAYRKSHLWVALCKHNFSSTHIIQFLNQRPLHKSTSTVFKRDWPRRAIVLFW